MVFPKSDAQFALTAENVGNLVVTDGPPLKIRRKYEQTVLEWDTYSIVCNRGADWQDAIYQACGVWIGPPRKVD